MHVLIAFGALIALALDAAGHVDPLTDKDHFKVPSSYYLTAPSGFQLPITAHTLLRWPCALLSTVSYDRTIYELTFPSSLLRPLLPPSLRGSPNKRFEAVPADLSGRLWKM